MVFLLELMLWSVIVRILLYDGRSVVLRVLGTVSVAVRVWKFEAVFPNLIAFIFVSGTGLNLNSDRVELCEDILLRCEAPDASDLLFKSNPEDIFSALKPVAVLAGSNCLYSPIW